jgi:hypothetical protein
MSEISPRQKKDPQKSEKEKRERKKEQGLKSKRGESSYEEAPCFKRRKEKKEDQMYKLLERFYRKKERRSHFPIMQNLMCGIIYTHTSFVFALPSIS